MIAHWPTVLDDGNYAELAILTDESGERVAMALARGDEPEPVLLGYIYDVPSAGVAADLIEHIVAMPEQARIGGEHVLDGADTSHPGVEWVAPVELSNDPDPKRRIAAGGIRRLWVVPSVTGDVLGLLAPNLDPEQLGEFVSVDAANSFIEVMDVLVADPRYSVFADDSDGEEDYGDGAR